MMIAEIVNTHGHLVGTVESLCDADKWCAALAQQTRECHMVRWAGQLQFGYYVLKGELRQVAM